VKSFVTDLICPLETNSITRNHSGLANPVSRGGRKSKKKDKMTKAESTPEAEDNWMKDERYDPELHLDPASLRRVAKNANRTLLRIRLLYYIKQEIIGSFAEQIDRDVPLIDLPICPPSLIIDSGPNVWWDKEADASLLAGTYKHGYEKYNIMRQDPALCFLSRCGPPDGSAVLAEISQEVYVKYYRDLWSYLFPSNNYVFVVYRNEDDIEKAAGGEDEDEESSNMEPKKAVVKEPETTVDFESAVEDADAEKPPANSRDEESSTPTVDEPVEKVAPESTDAASSLNDEKMDEDIPEMNQPSEAEAEKKDPTPESAKETEESTLPDSENMEVDSDAVIESAATVPADEQTADAAKDPEVAEPVISTTVVEEPLIEGRLPWPTSTDLNTRIRKLITAFQRYFKKEESKNAAKAKRQEKREKIEQMVRERERQKLEVLQKRWSKKEESDFCKTVSTFGIIR